MTAAGTLASCVVAPAALLAADASARSALLTQAVHAGRPVPGLYPMRSASRPHLVGSADQVQVVPLQEVRDAVRAKGVADATVILTPPLHSGTTQPRRGTSLTGQPSVNKQLRNLL